MIAALPVTLIGGYLGAGKTTLVNHLLREAGGLRIAVLVNDFGALPVDADLIVSRAANVIHLAGGCICCSFGSDLVAALMEVSSGERRLDHVIVETSGVSLPGSVASAIGLIDSLSLQSTVVVADAHGVRERAADAFVGDTITRQLAQANRVVLNKIDRVAPAELASLRSFIARAAPRAQMIETAFAAVAADVVLGMRSRNDNAFAGPGDEHDANALHETLTFVPDAPVDVGALAKAIADPRCGVLRAKGVLRAMSGRSHVVQIVDGEIDIAAFQGDGSKHEGIVCIGVRGRVNHALLEEAFAAAHSQGAGRTVNAR